MRDLLWLASLVLIVPFSAACASGLTPRQELTWDAYKACQSGGSGRLDQVWPDGRWHITGPDGEVNKLHACMLEYWQRASRDGRVPALPPSVKISQPSTTPSSVGLVASEPPTWARGDEWTFSSDGPTGKSTFVWAVDREEAIDGVPHYVIKTGRREIFYRKADIAFSRDTVDGAVVLRSLPSRLRYVWPLSKGATWEQTYRTERPVDRQTSDHIDVAAVEAEETITVPAGTFKTLKIVYRRKSTSAVYYEEWYSPELRMLVRGHERLESGSRIRELTAYRRNSAGPRPVAVAGWAADARTGCRVWNERPEPDETVSWSGACGANLLAKGFGIEEFRYSDKVSRYEGDFRDGRKHGWGVKSWPNGNRYVGEWREGRAHGKGVFTMSSGRFEGEWNDGCFRDGDRRAAVGRPLSECS